MEIKNKLTVMKREPGGGLQGKEVKGQGKKHEQRTHGHGQWGRFDSGSGGMGWRRAMGKLTEQQ